MTDRRTKHGPHPEDRILFSPAQVALIRRALNDFVLLLDRGYPRDASLKLVGDKFELRARQRAVLNRAACSCAEAAARKAKELKPPASVGRLFVDGYNVINTLECALGGAFVIRCLDGSYRDIGGVHGNYRLLADSPRAVELMLNACISAGADEVAILLDSPVSNSGRLRTLIDSAAANCNGKVSVQLVRNPDAVIISEADATTASSDSMVLDGCRRWYNVVSRIIENSIPNAWTVDLSGI